MFRILKELYKKESGQALILVALGLAVFLGFAAIVVDYGYLATQRRHLQNAADAAALAGAWELPKANDVKMKAKEYALLNAPEVLESEIKTYIQNSGKEVKVDVEHDYETFFAKVLESSSEKISATATAEKYGEWAGEALPFLNFDFDYSVEDPVAWTHVGNGIKGTIMDFYTRNQGAPNLYFEIAYSDGIQITPGFSNGQKGLDGSKLKDGLDAIISPSDKGVKLFYLFSLRDDYIKSGEFTVNNGNKSSISKLKNNDVVDPHQLVLIEVRLEDYDKSNMHNIKLTFTGNVFDLVDDFPTEHLSSGGYSRLIR